MDSRNRGIVHHRSVNILDLDSSTIIADPATWSAILSVGIADYQKLFGRAANVATMSRKLYDTIMEAMPGDLKGDYTRLLGMRIRIDMTWNDRMTLHSE